jgi:competence protein ComEA
MSTIPLPQTAITRPHVAHRAALGVGGILLALHALTGTTPATNEAGAVTAEQARLRLDPNVATREELMLLPRIGPTLAGYIIEYRASLAPGCAFRHAEDLKNVRGIGPLTVARLRPFLRFPPAPADAVGEVVPP